MWQWQIWMRLLTSPRCSQVFFSLAFNLNCSFWKWYTDSSSWRQEVSTSWELEQCPSLINCTSPNTSFPQPFAILPMSHTPISPIPQFLSQAQHKAKFPVLDALPRTVIFSALCFFRYFVFTDTNTANTPFSLQTPLGMRQQGHTNNASHIQAYLTWAFKAHLQSCTNTTAAQE